MKKVMTITAALLLSSWMASPGYGGPGISRAADAGTTPVANSESQTAPQPKIQAIGPDGKPMTKEEFAKAYKARMEAKTSAVSNRLEEKQDRWKKEHQEDGSGQSGMAGQ